MLRDLFFKHEGFGKEIEWKGWNLFDQAIRIFEYFKLVQIISILNVNTNFIQKSKSKNNNYNSPTEFRLYTGLQCLLPGFPRSVKSPDAPPYKSVRNVEIF